MSYSDILRPRPEVLSDEGIEGIIDLQNLYEKKKRKLENTPELFFDLTYPTEDVRHIIRKLNERFEKESASPGLFLLEGLKGSGKSHLLLLIYHLFKNPAPARSWLKRHELKCSLPDDVTIVVNKFTDLPLESIWDFVFEKASGKKPKKSVVQPSLNDVEQALDGKGVVLILDELEQGIRVMADQAIRNQNIAFLQMLSEWSNRSNQVTLFCSIYSDQEEPGSTLKRVPAVRAQFAHMPDKAKVVLHRIFKNYLELDNRRIAGAIESYLNLWRRHISFNADEYRAKLESTYPFLPEFLDLILERVPVRGGFQNVRGALGFLAHLVRRTHTKRDWITAAHGFLSDREVTARLADLDGSGLIPKARSNVTELKDYPFSDEIGAATMLYTLTGTGRQHGATKEELIRHILTPEADINDFERALLAFTKYASHFWCQEGRYYFDLEENPDAKVEFYSLRISDERARDWLARLWRDEVFREPQSVVLTDTDKTKETLEAMDRNRLRYVLAPRRLRAVERHDLYFGLQNRNLVILLEPKDSAFNLYNHPDLLKWAKRSIAAAELVGMTQESERRDAYERIGREDKRHCVDTIVKAGIVFVRWERYGENCEDDRIEEETLTGSSKDQVLNALVQQCFPQQLFEEHLASRLDVIMGRTVKSVDQEYRATLGFPVPVMTPRSMTAPIRSLCSSRRISVKHPRGNFSGENPSLNEAELLEAVIEQPFETEIPPPRPWPPQPPQPPPDETKLIIPPKPPVETRLEDIRIPPQASLGALRQEVASRLQAFPEGRVTRISFIIFSEQTAGDLSSLPAAFRGSLDGQGDITVEIRLTKEGDFSKAEVERFVEALPSMPRAEYSAQMSVVVPASNEG